MFVELHILQNFAPSNLNRDDTGAPKDCEFGGYRRARISSQCIKRAIRTCFRDRQLLPRESLASRTKRAVDALSAMLERRGRPATEARTVVQAALAGAGLAVDADGKTQYLLFLSDAEMAAVANICDRYWDQLKAAALEAAADDESAGRRQSGRDAKKQARAAVPPEVRGEILAALDGGRAADLALFGRMLADLPDRNVDAACQVAHAISTNRVSMEFDFYTAVDDLRPEDTAGADMLGTVEFNSACFYRYSNVDLDQLRENLHGDEELARRTAEAFLSASVEAVPTGKQNSMAAQNPPSLVFAVVRRSGLWSLANAFVQPVAADRNGDLVQNSARALDRYWGRLASMYGEGGVVGKWVCALDDRGLEFLSSHLVDRVDDLVRNVVESISFDGGEGGRRP